MTEQGSDRDPDSLPDSADLSGPCPRCGKISTFTQQGSFPLKLTRPQLHVSSLPLEQVVLITCAYCGQTSIVIEARAPSEQAMRGVHWWPTPGAGQMSDDVPAEVAAAYDEAKRCLGVRSPNAAAAMLRNTLAQIVQDKASDEAKAKHTLDAQLKQMTRDGGPVSQLADWTNHVKLYGNAGAHPEIFGPVTMPEAEDLAQLVFTTIELLYVTPATVARRQAGRPPRQ